MGAIENISTPSFSGRGGNHLEEFRKAVSNLVEEFSSNEFCKLIDSGKITKANYGELLKTILHQTYYSSNSFALAAAHCPIEITSARDYLLKHAEEEKDHWKWILDDLKGLGIAGVSITNSKPTPSCQAYISFNFHTSTHFPVGRLAIAIVLESIAANVGGKYAMRLCNLLGLKKNTASFVLSHAETDVVHTKEIWQVLEELSLEPKDWNSMMHSAECAMYLYREMYNEAVRIVK